MRVVLYTQDLEPITIIELPVWLLEELERRGAVKIAIKNPPSKSMLEVEEGEEGYEVLEVYCEKLRWRDGTLKPILVTNNDELALALRPEWLPGQQQAVNWYNNTIQELVEQLRQQFKKKGS